MTEFSFQGGRGGVISGKIGGRTGYMEWEMLVGDVNFVIYKSSGYWPGKEKIQMTDAEQEIFVNEFEKWASSQNFTYEID